MTNEYRLLWEQLRRAGFEVLDCHSSLLFQGLDFGKAEASRARDSGITDLVQIRKQALYKMRFACNWTDWHFRNEPHAQETALLGIDIGIAREMKRK